MNIKSPYRGLAAFEDSELDALYFFGRERDTEIVVANLIASRFTVLYGPSGVGKSSLLLAAVARKLRDLPEEPAVVVFSSWSDHPESALAAALAASAGIDGGELPDVAERAQVERDVYVILDQTEEYFTYHGDADGFERALAELVNRSLRVNVLLSLREDTLARLDRMKGRIPNLFANVLRLDRLDRAAGRAAILRPLERWRELEGEEVVAEDILVERVLDGVRVGRIELNPGGLGAVESNGSSRGIEAPYLQLVMQRLWDVERGAGSSTLRVETLDSLGGAGQIVADHLERAIDALTPSQRAIAARLFAHLVTPSGMKIAHEASDLATFARESEDGVRQVLRTLGDHRILRTDEGARWEIFHDVLAAAVLGWTSRFESDRAIDAERRRRRRTMELAAGVVAVVVVLAAIAAFAFAQRERAEARSRDAQARRLEAAGAAVLAADPELSLALASEAASLSAGATTEDALRNALLGSNLRGVLAVGQPVAALTLEPRGRYLGVVTEQGTVQVWALKSKRRMFERRVGDYAGLSFTRRSTAVVHGAAGAPVHVRLNGETICTYGRLATPGAAVVGDLVAVTSGELFDANTCRRVGRVDGLPPGFTAVVSGSTGRVAAFVRGQQAFVVDVRRRKVMSQLRHATAIATLTFDRRERRIVTAAHDSAVAKVWDVESGRLVRDLAGHFGDVVTADIDPSGQVVVTGSNDGQARVWDSETGAVVSVLSGHLNFVEAVQITAPRGYVLTGSPDQTARVWTDTARLVSVLAGHSGAVTSVSLTSDGFGAVTGSADGTVRLWDAGTAPDLVEVALPPPRPSPRLEATTRDGALVVRARDMSLRFEPSGRRPVIRTVHTLPITSVSFSPDESRVVTSSRDNNVILWDARSGRVLRVIPAHFGPVFDARFSPDGRWIVTAGPTAAGLWNASNGAFVDYLRGAPKPLARAAFTADSRAIVTQSRDGTVSRYRCEICGGIPELLALARSRLSSTHRALTADERESYLG